MSSRFIRSIRDLSKQILICKPNYCKKEVTVKLIIWCVVWLMQICSGKNGVFAPLSQSAVVKSTKSVGKDRPVGMKVRCMASSIPADRVPDMDKRNTMNLLLLGALSLPGTAMLVPYATFFAPPGFAFCSLLCFTLYFCSCSHFLLCLYSTCLVFN